MEKNNTKYNSAGKLSNRKAAKERALLEKFRTTQQVGKFYKGGSNPNSSVRKLRVSAYLSSIITGYPHVSSPGIGPMPYRKFTVRTVMKLTTDAAGLAYCTVDCSNLWSGNGSGADHTTGQGMFTMHNGTTVSPVTGATLGTGQVSNACGSFNEVGLVTRAGSMFLDSAHVTCQWIGKTLDDSGTITCGLIPQTDAFSNVTQPNSATLQDHPYSVIRSLREGCDAPWIPQEWGVPMKVKVGRYTLRNDPALSKGAEAPEPSTMIQILAQSSDNLLKEILLITIIQNVSVFTTDVFFTSGGSCTMAQGVINQTQQHIEKLAVGQLMDSHVNSVVSPVVGNHADSDDLRAVKKHHASKWNLLKGYIKEGWKYAKPGLKMAWDNRAKIGKFFDDDVLPLGKAALAAIEESGVLEVGEVAAATALLL